jgi:hypothetical protein
VVLVSKPKLAVPAAINVPLVDVICEVATLAIAESKSAQIIFLIGDSVLFFVNQTYRYFNKSTWQYAPQHY